MTRTSICTQRKQEKKTTNKLVSELSMMKQAIPKKCKTDKQGRHDPQAVQKRECRKLSKTSTWKRGSRMSGPRREGDDKKEERKKKEDSHILFLWLD